MHSGSLGGDGFSQNINPAAVSSSRSVPSSVVANSVPRLWSTRAVTNESPTRKAAKGTWLDLHPANLRYPRDLAVGDGTADDRRRLSESEWRQARP